jgi:hypothetical protein
MPLILGWGGALQRDGDTVSELEERAERMEEVLWPVAAAMFALGRSLMRSARVALAAPHRMALRYD